jgi:AcrR family transcriptional regulator
MLGETRQRIASAATQLLLANGAGAINHRAVAAGAGLTLGVVSHQCKRTDDLLRLAHAEVYRGLTEGFPHLPTAEGQATSDVAPRLQVLAIDELIIAVARGRAERTFALQLRYLRGATTRRLLTRTGDPADAGDGMRDLFERDDGRVAGARRSAAGRSRTCASRSSRFRSEHRIGPGPALTGSG